MKTISATLIGTRPMIHHNGRLNDPQDPIAKEMKKVSRKNKNKTEDDLDVMGKLEWRGGLYWSDALRCVAIPSDNILAMVIEGARKRKFGKQAQSGILETQPEYKLTYDGPAELDKLQSDERFSFRKRAKVQKNGVMRIRPIFRDWSLKIELLVDEELIDPDDVRQALVDAGVQIGLGDWRPRYGRFEVEGFKVK